jgi:hypothetical protein
VTEVAAVRVVWKTRPDPPNREDGMRPETRRKLDHVPALLKDEFPGLPHAAAVQAVESISDALLARATIEDFLPVLVHRFARERILAGGDVVAPVA